MGEHSQQSWVKKPKNESLFTELRKNYPQLLSKVLATYSFQSIEEVESFISPKLKNLSSPFTLKNMTACSERLANAIQSDESILIYGDYDMDGTSATCLMVSFLKECGCTKVHMYQPHRFKEGYGVHVKSLEGLHAKLNLNLIITVDTGITAVDPANYCLENNIDFMVTDHHQAKENLPQTPYILNPNLLDDSSNLKYLCGVGVAFYLCIATRHTLRNLQYFTNSDVPEPNLNHYLDLVTLGTIADVVDLVGDNRIIVTNGLAQLRTSSRSGIQALTESIPNQKIISRDVSFGIAPKLNAASRMGHVELSTNLLLCSSAEDAKNYYSEISKLNSHRKTLQNQAIDEATKLATVQIKEHDPKVLCIHGPWHEGILGIVAARLVDKFSLPAIVLNHVSEENLFRGSMRSIEPLDCVKLLTSCESALNTYGGHAMAAGLSLQSCKLDDFKTLLFKQCDFLMQNQMYQLTQYYVDEINSPISINEVVYLERLHPLGKGNEESLFIIKDVPVSVFTILKDSHIKAKIYGHSAIGFGLAKNLKKIIANGCQRIDALAALEINYFRGKKSAQFKINDFKPSRQTITS